MNRQRDVKHLDFWAFSSICIREMEMNSLVTDTTKWILDKTVNKEYFKMKQQVSGTILV